MTGASAVGLPATEDLPVPHADRGLWGEKLVSHNASVNEFLKSMLLGFEMGTPGPSATAFGGKWVSAELATFFSGLEHTVVVTGDSTVEGVGGLNYWPTYLDNMLSGAFTGGQRRQTDDAGGDDYGGFQHLDKSEWVEGADFAAIASSSVKDMGIFGIGKECLTGGTAAAQTATWTRPSTLAVARVDIFWVDVNTSGSVGWSYSTNGGGAWTDVAVTNPGSPALKVVQVTTTNPTDIRVRAAKADGTASRIPGLFGLAAYSRTDNVNTNMLAMHNLARSANFLVGFVTGSSSGDRFAIPRYLLVHEGLSSSHGLLIVGPFTNDLVLGVTPTQYGDACQEIVDEFSSYSDILFIGAFEQGGSRDVTTQNNLRAAMRSVALSNGCGYLDLRKCWGSFDEARGNGLMEDDLHESLFGHQDIAIRIFRILRMIS